MLQFDPALETNVTNGDDTLQFVIIPVGDLTGSSGEQADLTMVKDIGLFQQDGSLHSGLTSPSSLNLQGGTDIANLRRLNQRVNFTSTSTPAVTVDPIGGTHILMVVMRDGGTVNALSLIHI